MSSVIKELEYIDYRTNLIVFGFTHNTQTLLQSKYPNNTYYEIPSVIIRICLSYVGSYFMFDRGEFTWTISKPLLKFMLTSHSKKGFYSVPFEIGKIKWQLQIYPSSAFTKIYDIWYIFCTY